MRNIAVIVSLISLLAGCGNDPVIEPGTYQVHYRATFSTDPFVAIGEEFDGEWKIKENDGRYTLTINDTDLKGREVKGSLVFSYYKATGEECKFYTHLYAEIEPQGSGFTGVASQFYDFCSSYHPDQGITGVQDWATEYEVQGEAK